MNTKDWQSSQVISDLPHICKEVMCVCVGGEVGGGDGVVFLNWMTDEIV